MRHISFFLTQDQVKSRQKTVTRRGGWRKAEPGQLCVGVVKGQGLKPGERIQPLCIIQILSIRREPLNLMILDPEYGAREVRAEGFPDMTAAEFVAMYCEHNGGDENQEIARIKFNYREDVWSAYKRDFAQPENNKETTMPKDKAPANDKPAKLPGADRPPMDETQVKDEKSAVDAAFAKAPKGERPGVPTDPAFDDDAPAKAPASAVPMPEVPTFTQAIDPSEFLPAFQKIVFVKFSREDLAVRAVQMAECDTNVSQLELDKAEDVKAWNEKIKTEDGKRKALSAQVTAKGEEREIECRSRINEERQEKTIFDAKTLQVIEVVKLTDKELQIEMRMADTHRAAADTQKKKPTGAKVVEGNFPKDKVIGATAVENAEQDRKNDAAIKALADKKK
jgi:hypothetical protein